ncbi:MAG: indole-3-glycerol phosphate synthase TrpC [Eubacteriales bacterium]|nr:indole-3-glycerol phosphate synthase TrpC [Eubacteriales bacterium]
MILNKIAADTRIRVEEAKRSVSPEEMKEKALSMNVRTGFPFEKVFREPGLHFICEVKKASPSKGLIAEDFPYVEIARSYEKAGAAAVSVLTEPHFFQGSNEYLREIRANISIPILRKDFTVDPYQIFEAKVIGADAVLLIASLLSGAEIQEYQYICDSLGLSALVEVHDETELMTAVNAKARLIGVNNRNLKDFTVNLGNSLHLRELAPKEIPFIAESGIRTSEDVARLYEKGVNGILVGETLMRARDKGDMLRKLAGGCS